ncbi:MAG TPA: tetratricopeptide repeat protein [Acidobacteriota bacterium]|nr:tetratricopeptide repeat protein [Acidobacteriota bacterium]
MKRSLVLAALIALVASCAKSPQEQQQSLLDEGTKQIEKYQFAEADETFSRLTADFPASPAGRYGSGLALESQFLFYDALQVYMAVIEVAPSYAPAHAAAARVYLRLGKAEHAVRKYAAAAALPGCDPLVRGRRVAALIRIRDFDAAEEALRGAVASGLGEGPVDILTARLQVHRQQRDSAAATFEQALAAGVETPEFYVLAAEYCEDRGLVDSAMMFSAKSLEAGKPGFERRQDHFFRCLEHRYLYDARRLMQPVAAQDHTGSVISVMRMHYYWSEGDSHAAEKATARFWQLHDGRISPIIYDMKTRWMISDMMTCIGDLDMARSNVGRSDYVQSFRDFMNDEIELVGQIIPDLPSSPVMMRGTQGFKKGEKEFWLADLFMLRRNRMMKEFNARVDSLLAEHGSDPSWLTGLADVCARRLSALYDDAEQYYRRALQHDPYYRPALEGWVDMYQRRQMFAQARDVMKNHAPLVDAYPDLLLRQAAILARTGDLEAAKEKFRANYMHDRGDLAWYVDFADALARKDDLQGAAEVITLAVQANTENPDAYVAAGRWQADRGEYDTALVLADKGLALELENAAAGAIRAWSLCGLGETERAGEEFEQLLKSARGNVDVNTYYSRCLASTATDFRKAENLARTAVFLDGGSLASLMNLCHVYLQSDKIDFMRGEASRASHSYADSPDAYYYIGLADFRNGKPAARENLEKAIDLGLWGEKLVQAEDMLAKL